MQETNKKKNKRIESSELQMPKLQKRVLAGLDSIK
jgi:hypothetical protein